VRFEVLKKIKSFPLCCHVKWQIVTDVKDLAASICRVQVAQVLD